MQPMEVLLRPQNPTDTGITAQVVSTGSGLHECSVDVRIAIKSIKAWIGVSLIHGILGRFITCVTCSGSSRK